jgi:hypothetical protein
MQGPFNTFQEPPAPFHKDQGWQSALIEPTETQERGLYSPQLYLLQKRGYTLHQRLCTTLIDTAACLVERTALHREAQSVKQ